MKPFPSSRFAACGLCLLAALYGLPAAAFDLVDAFAAAKRHSAEYAAARHARDAEIEQEVQARSPLLPQVAATTSYQRQPASLSASLSANTVSRGWNVQALQVLFDRSAWAQYRQGVLAAEMAGSRLKQVEHKLLLEVAQAYFNVLLYQDQLAAGRREKDAYLEQMAQAKAMFDKGAATIVDAHEARAGFDAALAKEITALSQLQIARNTLSDLTGLDAAHISPLRRPVQPLGIPDKRTEAEWQAAAQRQNAEWRLQQLAASQANAGVKAAEGRHWPRLTLSGGYQDNRNTQEYFSRDQHYRSKGGTVTL